MFTRKNIVAATMMFGLIVAGTCGSGDAETTGTVVKQGTQHTSAGVRYFLVVRDDKVGDKEITVTKGEWLKCINGTRYPDCIDG